MFFFVWSQKIQIFLLEIINLFDIFAEIVLPKLYSTLTVVFQANLFRRIEFLAVIRIFCWFLQIFIYLKYVRVENVEFCVKMTCMLYIFFILLINKDYNYHLIFLLPLFAVRWDDFFQMKIKHCQQIQKTKSFLQFLAEGFKLIN